MEYLQYKILSYGLHYGYMYELKEVLRYGIKEYFWVYKNRKIDPMVLYRMLLYD